MKRLSRGLLAGILMVCVLSGCKKDSTTGPEASGPGSKISDADRTAISSTTSLIKASLDSLLKTTNPEAGLPAMLAKVQGYPNVESASIQGQVLVVKFKNGGRITWLITNDVVVPPYDQLQGLFSQQTSRTSAGSLARIGERVGDTTALLINQQYADEGRQYCRDLITYLNTKLHDNGFLVTTRNGSSANVAFFKSGLKGFGTIFYIAHGYSDGSHIWQLTGQEGNVDSVMLNYTDDWLNDYLSVSYCKEKRGGSTVVTGYLAFSEDFISHYYAANDFPHSLVYLVACQAFKGSTAIGQAFASKGVAATVGWDETNCLGQSTGKLLYDAMLGGATLADAMAGLPAEAKLDKCHVAAGASLMYYPAAGGTVQLVVKNEAVIQIISPLPNQSYADRVQTLSGKLRNAASITSGTVEVGGVTTTMVYTDTTYSQRIDLKQGSNRIHITCFGKDRQGKALRADTTYTVTGNFAQLDLWTELRWNANNADVDFHLLPPGKSTADLWTTSDCYYRTMSPTWGGKLDIDDVNGYGPEHITLPTATTTGVYRLFVHYYAKHGAGSTSAYVTVSVKGGADMNFGPKTLSNDGGDRKGDLWEVCTITYPAGTVAAVGTLTTLAKIAKGTPIPAKQ